MADAHCRVLGASILGVHAGELAAFWALAITQRLKLRDIAGLILPYPTRGEIAKAVAAEFYKPLIAKGWLHRLVRFLFRFP